MRFVIAGAGEVGYHIVESIHREGVNITVIDGGEAVLQRLHRLFWVDTVLGNASNRDVLEKAQVGGADLFIAVTSSDEINIISSLIAKEMGAKQGIARLTAFNEVSAGDQHSFGISLVINPFEAAAEHLEQLALHPSTIDFVPFLGGDVALIGAKVRQATLMDGMQVQAFGENTKLAGALIALVERDGTAFIPRANTVVAVGDSVYFLCIRQQWKKLGTLLGLPTKPSYKVFINGGGLIGESLALRLERRGLDVRVIEKDERRCEVLSQILDHSLVLNADGTDDLALKSEGIGDADCFFSACDDDEVNLLSCLMAKEMGARATVALIRQSETIAILHRQDLIDAAINPRLLTARKILQYVQGTNLRSFFSFPNSTIEVVELEVHKTSPCVGKMLRSLKLPAGALLVGSIRRKGRIYIPRGEEKLQAGDVVLLVQKRNCREISRLLFWPIPSARQGALVSGGRALQEKTALSAQAQSLAEEMVGFKPGLDKKMPNQSKGNAGATPKATPLADPKADATQVELVPMESTSGSTKASSAAADNPQLGPREEVFGFDTVLAENGSQSATAFGANSPTDMGYEANLLPSYPPKPLEKAPKGITITQQSTDQGIEILEPGFPVPPATAKPDPPKTKAAQAESLQEKAQVKPETPTTLPHARFEDLFVATKQSEQKSSLTMSHHSTGTPVNMVENLHSLFEEAFQNLDVTAAPKPLAKGQRNEAVRSKV